MIYYFKVTDCGDYVAMETKIPGRNTESRYRDAGLLKLIKEGFVITEQSTFLEIDNALRALFGPVFQWMNRDNGRFLEANPNFGVGVAPYMTDLPPYVLAFKQNGCLRIALCSPFFTGTEVVRFVVNSRRGLMNEMLYLSVCRSHLVCILSANL